MLTPEFTSALNELLNPLGSITVQVVERIVHSFLWFVHREERVLYAVPMSESNLMFIRDRLLCLLLQILHLFVDLSQIRITDPIQSSVNLRKLIKQWTIKLSKGLLDLLKLLLNLERFLSCEPLLSFSSI